MAFLQPDNIITAAVAGGTIEIKQKITPDGARADRDICSYVKKGDLVKPNAPLSGGTGIPKGITVHNTGDISCASGTTPAEQYARATYPNGNMNGVAVHYWVWHDDVWQQLSDNERGWHAADGSSRRSSHRAGQTIGGNLDTISIECIGADAESEDTTAKLVAYLCAKHGLDPALDVYTHNYFYSQKYCPLYILPHWDAFMATVQRYADTIEGAEDATDTTEAETPQPEQTQAEKKFYRVQIGAFTVKANAEACLTRAKAAGFSDAYIKNE